MTARRLLAGLVAVVAAGAFAVAAAGTSTAQSAPTASVSPGAAAPGSPVIVRGSGFAPGTLVSVELCGNEARRGSADCDQSSALDAGASSTGDVAVQLIVGTPPSPCPCVVKLTGLGSSATASTPFVVSGAPTADPGTLAAQYPDVSRQINVIDAHFTGSGPWTAWFGASPHRELVYTVQNIGNVAVQDPPIIIAVGKSDNPTGIVHPPPLGTLAPGESQTYHTTVDLGAFSWGQYHAVGSIPGFADPVRFTASTTNYPWALILIVVIGLFELILIKARNRARKRLARATDSPGAPRPRAGAQRRSRAGRRRCRGRCSPGDRHPGARRARGRHRPGPQRDVAVHARGPRRP